MPTRIHRILIVEDNMADARLIQEAFRECEYRCYLVVVDSPAAAKECLATQSFELLISDFGIDQDAALEFFSSVRRIVPLLPIVVLSGTYDPTPAYLAGVNVFVRKPGDLQEFFSKIQSIMHFWVDVAELPNTPTAASQPSRTTAAGERATTM